MMIAVGIALAISATAAVIWTKSQSRRLDPKREVLDFDVIVERFYRGGDVTMSDVQIAYERVSEATGVRAER